MRKSVFCIVLSILCLLLGCNQPKETNISHELKPYEKLSFTMPTEIMTFCISTNREIFALKAGGKLGRYEHDGTKIQEYENSTDYLALCWGDDSIYAFDAVKYQIVSLNIENGNPKVIVDNLNTDEILKLAMADGYLYALAVSDAHGHSDNSSKGYTDFGEKLYQIDPQTGKTIDTQEDNIIAIYGGSDGTLYYYAYRNDTYALYTYSQGKSKKIHDMKYTSYISAFIYENGQFIYSTIENPSLIYHRFSDKIDIVIAEDTFLLSGNDMTFLDGNVIYYGYHSSTDNALHSIYLEDISLQADSIKNTNGDDTMNTDSRNSSKSSVTPKDTITISTPLVSYYNTNAVKNSSGINARIMEQNPYYDVVITELMSGNSDADIYIGIYSSYLTSGVLDKKIYVPLDDSEIIQSYRDKLFPYVADTMTSPSGDIWMLPLSIDADVLWYVPENMKKYDVDLAEFRYLDSFLKLCERMPKTGYPAAYVDSGSNLAYNLHNQYDIIYNDYINKKMHFDTPFYKDFFDKMWSGWMMYSPAPRHPMLRNSYDDNNNNELFEETAPYDKTRIIYKYTSAGGHINIADAPFDGWRVAPCPHINPDMSGNIVYMTYAYINPNSPNKEQALKYLEAITEVPFEFHTFSTFLFQDKTIYEGHYDTTQPAFDDLYSIMEEGVLRNNRYILTDNPIVEYQNGRLTLDEAVEFIQREATMWANE